MTAIGLKSGKKSINLVCWHSRDPKVTLKLKLQITNFPQRLHIEVVSDTVCETCQDLPFPSYMRKYVKIFFKKCLSRVVMDLKQFQPQHKVLIFGYARRIY